jgi:hypothetical protein
MIQSLIRKEVRYTVKQEIDNEDVGYESTTYDTELLGTPVELAIGKEKYNYSKHDLVFFYLYLVLNEELVAKVAIFEVESDRLISILDSDGDIDITKGRVIPTVSEKYLNKLIANNPTKVKEEASYNELSTSDNSSSGPSINPALDEDIDKNEDDLFSVNLPTNRISKEVQDSKEKLKTGVFIKNPAIKMPELLEEETQEAAKQMRREFVSSPSNKWVVNFMENNNYSIVDNEGGGDCFFAVIRDAFRQIGQETTVDKLRSLLSNEATEDQYEQYRTIYLGLLSEQQSIEKELKEIKRIAPLLKKRTEASKDKAETEQIVREAKQLADKHKQFLSDKKQVSDNMSEFSFMKNIDNLEKLREYIKTSQYWADTWAVSTMERLLNIKLIILSEESYKAEDIDSVLKCGQLNDSDLERQGQYKPDFYIMTCYNGYHYKLITYKEKRIFKFQELPYDIKMLVINKCLERNAGPYYLIQDFRNLKTQIGLDANEGEPYDNEEEDYLKSDLYDKDIVFQFHSKADVNPKAGKGSGEQIPKEKLTDFTKLNGLKDWRRKLDDSWSAPFKLDGHRWNSIEHYVLGSQFKKGFPDFYLQFSLDSGSDISMDLTLAKAAAGKTGKHKDRVLRDVKKIKPDADFYELGQNQRSVEERKRALDAKFTQNLDLRQVLGETKRAKLVHFIRGFPAETDELLMKLRREG